ncbi:MAG: hypothetical protein WDO56_31470 [Gammaproteobacteria bacterium]
MQSKHQRIRVRILVKAFPQHSQKYEETVCCAGVTTAGQLIRLFPITYRRLSAENRFDRFDLIEAILTKSTSDPRPESFRVDHDSIRVVERGKSLSDESKVLLWRPHVASSLEALQNDNKSTERSLGIIHPDPGSMKFFWREAKADEQEDARGMQASLFEKPLQPLAPPEFVFGYKYTSAGKPHTHTLQDWEVQAAYSAYLRRYETREDALKMLDQEYGTRIPTRHPHFIMGTMKVHPRNFILIGLLRTGLDPEELAKQGSLF